MGNSQWKEVRQGWGNTWIISPEKDEEAHTQTTEGWGSTDNRGRWESKRSNRKWEAEGKQELKLREGGQVEKHRGEKEEN